MYEGLYAHVIFIKTTPRLSERYKNYLDDLFIENSEDELILELQWCTNDLEKTVVTIMSALHDVELDYVECRKAIIAELEVLYNELELEEFAELGYSVWNNLEGEMRDEKPLNDLCFADDPLSWGDKEQSIEIYQKLFRYYD